MGQETGGARVVRRPQVITSLGYHLDSSRANTDTGAHQTVGD
jgi:hypothetical protein